MAETYEQYEKNKQTASKEGWTGSPAARPTFEDRLEAAMDQTELLKAVRRRVETFLRIYEERNADLRETAQAQREHGQGHMARAMADRMEADYQEVATVSGYSRTDSPEERLLLDDLKVLLAEFPQKDW
jgi:hypothetical protein